MTEECWPLSLSVSCRCSRLTPPVRNKWDCSSLEISFMGMFKYYGGGNKMINRFPFSTSLWIALDCRESSINWAVHRTLHKLFFLTRPAKPKEVVVINYTILHLYRTNKHFESSQKLRKDGIGIWKNFIGNMLSNNILWFWLSTYTFYLYTVVLWLNFPFCCQPLSYDSSGQPSHCTCSLLYYAGYWYWCTELKGFTLSTPNQHI